MSLQHPCNSCDDRSELDLFTVPPTQLSIEKAEWKKVPWVGSLTDNTVIEFTQPPCDEKYIDLANTLLEVKCSIRKADGTKIDAHSHVGPVNTWMHTLFSKIDVTMGNTVVTSQENYPYKAYLENLLSYSPAAKDSHLRTCLFYKDTAGKLDDPQVTNDDEADCNKGLQLRSAWTAEGKTCHMMGRLHVEPFMQDRYLLNKVRLVVRLYPQRTGDFSLMSNDDNARYKVHLEDVALYMRLVDVSTSTRTSHHRELEAGRHAVLPVKRVICKPVSIPAQTLQATQLNNLFSGQIPRRLVLGFVDATAYQGDFKKNPFNFHHYKIQKMSLDVDNVTIPAEPLELDFDNQLFCRSYMSLFTGTGMLFQNSGNGITWEEYA